MAGEVAVLLPLDFVSRAVGLKVTSGVVFLFLVRLVPTKRRFFFPSVKLFGWTVRGSLFEDRAYLLVFIIRSIGWICVCIEQD